MHELINLACESDQPIVIVDGDTEAGVVGKRALLRGVLGGQAKVGRAAELAEQPLAGNRCGALTGTGAGRGRRQP